MRSKRSEVVLFFEASTVIAINNQMMALVGRIMQLIPAMKRGKVKELMEAR